MSYRHGRLERKEVSEVIARIFAAVFLPLLSVLLAAGLWAYFTWLASQ